VNRDDRGAGTLMVAMVAAGCVGLVALGVIISAYVVATHRARQAADLAVLAAAHAYASGTDPCRTAVSVAEANSATATRCSITGTREAFAIVVTTRVAVRLRVPAELATVTATSRAGTPAT
jgi:secretion/DNA translocation related TadE-like protein